jgi:tRNA(adenine34) deaminase
MLCLTAGAAALENWRLLRTTLYSTLEPCTMCAGALLLSRVERIVWGAPDTRQGACGSWLNVFAQPHPMHSIEVTSGVLAEECGALLKEFFRKKRKEANVKVMEW